MFKNLFEEGLHIQRCRLRELQRYARDKRMQQQQRQYNEVISLENYYKDQFNMLAETLEKEKHDLHVRDAAQTKVYWDFSPPTYPDFFLLFCIHCSQVATISALRHFSPLFIWRTWSIWAIF